MINIERQQPASPPPILIPQPRKKYQKVNGFTHPLSSSQIMGLFLIFLIITIHSLLIASIIIINHTLLYLMTLTFYVTLLVVCIEYCRLTLSDPVDPRLLTSNYPQQQRDIKLILYCDLCHCFVHKYSYHCHTCKRCVQEFDHHCLYTNNCVGKQNYPIFFRLLLFLILFLLLGVGQGVWIFVQQINSGSSGGYEKWTALGLVVVSVVLACVLGYLTAFHIYISFWKYGTTLEYIRKDRMNEQREGEGDQRKEQKNIPLKDEGKQGGGGGGGGGSRSLVASQFRLRENYSERYMGNEQWDTQKTLKRDYIY